MLRVMSPVAAAACVVLTACSGPDQENGSEAAPAPAASAAAAGPHVTGGSPVEVGRYLVRIGGCNDCHTEGFAPSGGQTPEAQWLTGSREGLRGPWGTTYAKNLRLFVNSMTEDEFVQVMRTRKAAPPMPWPSVNAMHESDTRAIYQYIKTLNPTGEQAPANVPPGQEPTTPYITFAPPTMPSGAGGAGPPGPTPQGPPASPRR
jgi:hypothetical protein